MSAVEVEPTPTQEMQMGVVAAVGEHAVESHAFGWNYADDDAPASEELQQAAETVADMVAVLIV